MQMYLSGKWQSRQETVPVTNPFDDSLIDTVARVLVDEPGVARSHREAPEIDGIISVPADLAVGQFHDVRISAAQGPDLIAEPSSGEPLASSMASAGRATHPTESW